MRQARLRMYFWGALATTVLACSGGNTTGGNGKDGGTDDSGGQACPTETPYASEGLCYYAPKYSSKRTQCGEIVDNCDTSGTSTPQLSCWQGDPPAAPSGKESITLAGFVDVFSNGPNSDKITISVYDAKELEDAIAKAAAGDGLAKKTFPSGVSPIGSDTASLGWDDKSAPPSDPVRGAARACPQDKKLGLPCVVPADSCGAGGALPYCDLQANQYCHDGECIERLRWEIRYRIENIPTNRRLVIRVHGPGEFDDGTWGIMAMWNIYLRADAANCEAGETDHCLSADGAYQLEVNALSRADYATIPITAGLSGGIPAGHGAIAGEVRDCDNIKLEGVQVTTEPSPIAMVYFNGNPIKTLPDVGRYKSGTNADGLFSALDIRPGLVQVGALALVGDEVVTAGTMTVGILPDTVTVIAFDGPDPNP